MKRSRTDSELSLESPEFLWEEPGLTEAHHWILPVVRTWLQEAGVERVLDLGCGNGALTHALAEDGYRVVGLELSASGVEIARRAYPSLTFVQADLQEPLPLALQGEFEVVVAVEVVEHLLFPRLLFERARQALVGGGRLIVTTPFHGYWKNLALAVTGRFDDHWHPLRDFGHVKFFSERTLSELFRQQGFSVTRRARVGRVPALARSLILQGDLP